jgi:hypothetical protein
MWQIYNHMLVTMHRIWIRNWIYWTLVTRNWSNYNSHTNLHSVDNYNYSPRGGGKDLALQVGGVSNETVKYVREFCGTWTREWLLWQGPEAIVRVTCRYILSSERTPHLKKPAIVNAEKNLVMTSRWSPSPRQAGRLIVGRKLTSVSTITIARIHYSICSLVVAG